MNQMGPMKPWIRKIPPPRISAAGILGPNLVHTRPRRPRALFEIGTCQSTGPTLLFAQ